jgi:predicted flap endonuclease-1-like 5' DNA nuclease
MSTILSAILITAPLTFMAGWLLSKALFRHLSSNSSDSASYASQTSALSADHTQTVPSVLDSDQLSTTTQDRNALHVLQKHLTASQVDCQALTNETQLLKEAAAERNQQLFEVKQKLALLQSPPEAAKADSIENLQQAKEMRDQQDKLAAKDEETIQLTRELIHAEASSARLSKRSSKWRGWFKALSKQIRQQRMIISELREELRQRELRRENEALEHQRELDAASNKAPAEPATTVSLAVHQALVPSVEPMPSVLPAATPTAMPAPPPVQPQSDNLRQLKGIGPALQKKLNNKGIYRFQQLADMDQAEALKLGKSLNLSEKLINKNDWAKQAQEVLGVITETADATPQVTEEAVPA